MHARSRRIVRVGPSRVSVLARMSDSWRWVGDLRGEELARVLRFLPPGSTVLDFGAGSGQQARRLSELGFRVAAVDVESSPYLAQSVFPVHTYDGRSLPFADRCFDVVMSSNVMEHVDDLPSALRELRRILKPDGVMLHVLPSSSWRLWTTGAEFIAAPRNMIRGMRRAPYGKWGWMSPPWWTLAQLTWLVRPFLFRPHGERGNALTELWRFSRGAWRRQFEANGWVVEDVVPLRIWYTGETLVGPVMPISVRTRVAARLGSATILYVLRPGAPRDAT